MGYAFTLEGPSELIRDIERLEDPNLEAGVALPMSRTADVLDSPFGVEEIRQIAEVITVLAGAGTGVVALASRIREFFSKQQNASGKGNLTNPPDVESARVVVRDPKTCEIIAVIDDVETLDLFVSRYP